MAVAIRAQGRDAQRRRRDRRRRHVGRHGLRGDEQCRRHGCAADRHPQRQRHVDRAADRRACAPISPRWSRARSIAASATRAKQITGKLPQAPPRDGAQDRGIRPLASSPAARCSRSSASTMSARSTATTSTTCCRARRTSATPTPARSSSTSSPRRARATRPAENCRRQVSRRLQVQRHHRRAGQGRRPTRPSYTSVFAESLIAEARRDDRIVAVTAAMPSGTGLDKFAEIFPDPHLRCRHRRAARRDLRRRPRHRGHEAVLRDLLDLPAARLRPGGPRRRRAEPAGALRHRPRRLCRRRRPDPCRQLRHRLSRRHPRHGADGRRRRGRAAPHGARPPPPTTTARSPSATRAATASASTCRSAASSCRSARAASLREGSDRRASSATAPASAKCSPPPKSSPPSASTPPSPTPAS